MRADRAAAALALCLGGAALLAAGPAAAGAWTQPEGRGQIITSVEISRAGSAYGPGGGRHSTRDLTQFYGGLYGEYGLTDTVTLFGQLGAKHLRQDQGGGAGRLTGGGIEDPILGARFRLWQDDRRGQVFSLQAAAILPGLYDDDRRLSIGTGNLGAELRPAFGMSFTMFGMPAFIDASLGYRVRFGPGQNEFRPDVTLGVRPAPGWLLLGQTFNVISDGSAVSPRVDTREHKLSFSIVRDITERVAVQFGAFHVVAGRNTPALSGIILGLWYSF
ncbi:MAG: transporter [Alphaproteobacteria bacterium]|nr:transporter [Alphaproteobacteria bacterium]